MIIFILTLLADALQNVRFGDAHVNLHILYGFDPNRNGDGSLTPFTSEINRTTRNLVTAKLVSADIIKNALLQTVEKLTGAPQSSSILL